MCRIGSGRDSWLAALDTIETLAPAAVVSGHKRDGDPDSPEDIDKSRGYIHDFDDAAKKAVGHQDLYDAIVSLYPDRLNRGVLWNSAQSVMG